jgi:hypothetical protein
MFALSTRMVVPHLLQPGAPRGSAAFRVLAIPGGRLLRSPTSQVRCGREWDPEHRAGRTPCSGAPTVDLPTFGGED